MHAKGSACALSSVPAGLSDCFGWAGGLGGGLGSHLTVAHELMESYLHDTQQMRKMRGGVAGDRA